MALPERNCVVCGRWFTPSTERNSMCGDQCRKLRRRLICTLWYADDTNRKRHIRNVCERRAKRRA